MTKLSKDRIKDILIKIMPYVVTMILVTIVMNLILDLGNRDFNHPFYYDGGDGAITLYRTYEMRTDHTLFGFNQLSAPYGTNTFDFYVFDIGLYIIQFLFAVLAPNFVFGFNLFLIAGAWFNALASVYALKRLKFSSGISIVLSVIYSAIQFFTMRFNGHTYLAYFFAAPLAIVIAIELYRDEFEISFKKGKRVESSVNAFLLILIGTSGIYWAVFSCLYFLLIALLRGFEDLKIRSTIKSGITIGITVVGFLIGVLPAGIYWLINGTSELLKARGQFLWSGEVYGLKLTELILPNIYHRVGILYALRRNYTSTFGMNESSTASLGIVLTIGLAIALVYLFRVGNSKRSDLMKPVSLLIVASLLIAYKGGLGTLFVIVFPYVRCYNRISVYIAFLCVVAVAWAYTGVYNFLKSKFKHKSILNVIACIVLVLLLVYDNLNIYCVLNILFYNRI